MTSFNIPEFTNNSLEFVEDKIQDIVDTINQAFVVKTSAFDPSKFSIEAINPNQYKFGVSVDTVYWYLKGIGKQISKTDLRGLLREPNYFEPVNPAVNYFDSIRGTYKGKSHIDLLCKFLTARSFEEDSTFYAERMNRVLRKWIVATVAQWLDGIPNPVALGFIAIDEFMGKTFLTKFLLPESLQDYYVQLENNERFQMSDFFSRYMIVCFDELVGLNRGSARIEEFKKYMREPTVMVQRRFEDFPSERPRMAAAMFTTNKVAEMGGFLSELHGYSRFATIELERVDKSYSKKVDVDQIYAEALMLFEGSEFDYIYNDEEIVELIEYNKRYMIQNEETKYVNLYLSHPKSESDEKGVWCTPTEIIETLKERKKILLSDANKLTPQRVGYALTNNNYEKRSKRLQGEINPAYRYHVCFDL